MLRRSYFTAAAERLEASAAAELPELPARCPAQPAGGRGRWTSSSSPRRRSSPPCPRSCSRSSAARSSLVDLRDLWPDEVVAVGAASEGSLSIRVLRMIERLMYRSADLVTCTTPRLRRDRRRARRRPAEEPAAAERRRPRALSAAPARERRRGALRVRRPARRHVLGPARDQARPRDDDRRGGAPARPRGRRLLHPRRGAAPRGARGAGVAELGLENVVFGGERPIEEVPLPPRARGRLRDRPSCPTRTWRRSSP